MRINSVSTQYSALSTFSRMSEIAIRCQGLNEHYRMGERESYQALRDVITDSRRVSIPPLARFARRSSVVRRRSFFRSPVVRLRSHEIAALDSPCSSLANSKLET